MGGCRVGAEADPGSPRDAARKDRALEQQGGEVRALAILAISPAAATVDVVKDLESHLGKLKKKLALLPSPQIAPYWSEGRLILAYADVADAAETAVRLIIVED